jgi:hypothetical protein
MKLLKLIIVSKWKMIFAEEFDNIKINLNINVEVKVVSLDVQGNG